MYLFECLCNCTQVCMHIHFILSMIILSHSHKVLFQTQVIPSLVITRLHGHWVFCLMLVQWSHRGYLFSCLGFPKSMTKSPKDSQTERLEGILICPISGFSGTSVLMTLYHYGMSWMFLESCRELILPGRDPLPETEAEGDRAGGTERSLPAR